MVGLLPLAQPRVSAACDPKCPPYPCPVSPSLDSLLLKGVGTLCPGEAHLQPVSRLTPHWPQGPRRCTLAPPGTRGTIRAEFHHRVRARAFAL